MLAPPTIETCWRPKNSASAVIKYCSPRLVPVTNRSRLPSGLVTISNASVPVISSTVSSRSVRLDSTVPPTSSINRVPLGKFENANRSGLLTRKAESVPVVVLASMSINISPVRVFSLKSLWPLSVCESPCRLRVPVTAPAGIGKVQVTSTLLTACWKSAELPNATAAELLSTRSKN